ncbi:TPM domain-containing protein [Pontixanthobacter gangjinensis]|uniref:Methanol dehydrogenase n=1 Tax=Pontixanthobacter gangjinensis TaxID=1028742 RepID=A0A6I4SQY8_9SPHN|nr:TPM domain-containing protein [Pontixanthobacter gangjinensis]MXO57570.1 methanol dehydrogenase [Pontixanthobacter gangjinensis]
MLIAAPLAAQTFPELTGQVVDNADIIPDADEAALTARLEALETQSQRQYVIVTLPDLQGYDIADYGYQLGREWGIGDAERNDGVLLIVAPNERKTRIEVGYGLEPVLTDGLTTLIVQKQMLPFFKEGDYVGGINIATDTIIQQLTLPPEEAQAIAAQVGSAAKAESSGARLDFPTIIFLGFFLLFVIIPMFRSGGKRGKRYKRGLTGSTVGDIILWEVANAALRGASGGDRSGGFGGGGFGGGGGFSGGGGSFGGGGASGGW